MDRNQLIGVVLLVLLMVGYFWLVPRPEPPVPDTTATAADSVKTTETQPEFKQSVELPDSVKEQISKTNYGSFAQLVTDQTSNSFKVRWPYVFSLHF